MKLLTVRIKLVNAAEEDYLALRSELEPRGFTLSPNESSTQTAQYTFNGETDAESVAHLAHQSTLKLRKHFFISVSDPHSARGLGIAG